MHESIAPRFFVSLKTKSVGLMKQTAAASVKKLRLSFQILSLSFQKLSLSFFTPTPSLLMTS